MLADYCLKNPFLVLWNCALILGGVIAFAHFTNIGYFPDLDVKTASSFLLGIALLGFLLISILAVLFAIPSYMIRTEVWKRYYLHDPTVTGQAAEPVPASIEKRRRVLLVCLTLCHGLAAFFFWLFIVSFALKDTPYKENLRYVCGGGFILMILVLLGLGSWWRRRLARDDATFGGRLGQSHKAQHFTLSSIWLIILPGYLILILLSAGKLRENDIDGHLVIFAFAVAFIVANAILAVTSFRSPKSYWIVPVVPAVLLLIYVSIPSNPFSITRTVFFSLSLGDVGNSRFVVKRPMCDAVNLTVPGACEVASESLGCIRPKSVANRIGSEYLLILAERAPIRKTGRPGNVDAEDAPEIKVPIPKSEVLAWAIANAHSANWVACGPATEGRSTTMDKKARSLQ